MKDRASNSIVSLELDWGTIQWKQVTTRVNKLRKRIFRATTQKKWNTVRSLMKLMLRSYSNLLLSIRRVTQLNKGKNTPGIDNRVVETNEQRSTIVRNWQGFVNWEYLPAKRIYIPKSNGKFRPLGIPGIYDRIAQAMMLNAWEPRFEAVFEPTSYGFRPGRSTHDAMIAVYSRFSAGNDTYALDADIKGAFDNISHNFIINQLGNLPGREMIKGWLKAGYMEQKEYVKTDTGTPQGGIISPLLANIALDGLQEFLNKFKKKTPNGFNKKGKQNYVYKYPKFGFIRYADDFIITAQTKTDLEEILPLVKEWLARRGLKLNDEKTKARSISDGFDFLGFNFRHYSGKCIVKPQKEKVIQFLREISTYLKENASTKTEYVIRELNSKLRGWGNYYRVCNASETLSKVAYHVWNKFYQWCIRRHPRKGKRWIAKKYFRTVGKRTRIPFATFKDRKGREKYLNLFDIASIPIIEHRQVAGSNSPDNPDLNKYWEQRKTRTGKTIFASGSKYQKIAEQQNYVCPICGEPIYSESWELHHIKPVKDGGTDEIENLVFLHKVCHKSHHKVLHYSEADLTNTDKFNSEDEFFGKL